MSTTTRISQKSDDIIHEIVTLTGKTKKDVIEKALEVYCHLERMRLLNEGYQRLRSDKFYWKEELKERQELDGTLQDGLEDE